MTLKTRLHDLSQTAWGKRYDRAYVSAWKIACLATLDILSLLSMTFVILAFFRAQQFSPLDTGDLPGAIVMGMLCTWALWQVGRLVIVHWFWRSMLMTVLSMATSVVEMAIHFRLIGFSLVNYFGLSHNTALVMLLLFGVLFLLPSLMPVIHILIVRTPVKRAVDAPAT